MVAAASMNTNHSIGHANQIPNISSFPLLSYVIRCPSPTDCDSMSGLLSERNEPKPNFYLFSYYKGSFTTNFNVDARFDAWKEYTGVFLNEFAEFSDKRARPCHLLCKISRC